MGLYFHNSTASTKWVVFAYYAPNCAGVTYAKKGWYQIVPGATAYVWSGWAGSDTFYYYAEDGGTYSGPYFTQVPYVAFDWCWNTGQVGARNLGFRKIGPIAWYIRDYTINLV